MVAAIVVSTMMIGMLCVIAYRLAAYALPFALGLAATRFAYGSGAGLIGAGLVGLVAGMASFAVMELLFPTLRAPVLRIAVALIFTAPAVVAGYALVQGPHRRDRAVSDLAADILDHRRNQHRRLRARPPCGSVVGRQQIEARASVS